jgi:uncharacterized protein
MTETGTSPKPGSQRFVELFPDECLRRLAASQIGRLAVVVDHYPQVFCVNYRFDEGVIVFRCGEETNVHAADHQHVGFEVDAIDYATRTGWTVLVQGTADDITDRHEDPSADHARRLDVEPWTPGAHPRIIRIIPAEITGRELTARDLTWSTDDRGYL